MFDVVVLGSANLDLVARTERLPNPGETVSASDYREYAGGKGLNQAVAAARAGAAVAFVGAVGDDAAGEMLRDVLTREGIDDSWLLSVRERPTGRALITVDDTGENSIVVVPGANTAVSWPHEPPSGHVVLAQLEIDAHVVATAFAQATRAGAVTILNPAPARRLDPSLIADCSFVVPNEHEVAAVGGSDRLLRSGVETVVVTRGGDGVDVVTEGGTDQVASFPVAPVDTTGAGDAFCGYLAAHLARGDSTATTVRWGAAAGALATTSSGAVPSLPRATDVARLVATTHGRHTS